MTAHRWICCLGFFAVLAALAARPTLAQAAQEALWAGVVQCEVNTKSDGYAHREIQTWTMSGQPRQQGAMEVYPGTWSTKGEGATLQAQGTQKLAAQWSSNVSPVNAPIAIFVRASDKRLIIKSWHMPLSVAGGLSGVRQVSVGNASPTQTTMAASAGEWPFPGVEDDATTTNIRGSGTVVVLGNLLPMQTASAKGTAGCQWKFSKGAASLPGVNVNSAAEALLHPSTEPNINREQQPESGRAKVSQFSTKTQAGLIVQAMGSGSSTRKQGADPGGGADVGAGAPGSQTSTQSDPVNSPGAEGAASPGTDPANSPQTEGAASPGTDPVNSPGSVGTASPGANPVNSPGKAGKILPSSSRNRVGLVASDRAAGSAFSSQNQAVLLHPTLQPDLNSERQPVVGSVAGSTSSTPTQAGGPLSMSPPVPTAAPGTVQLQWTAPASTGSAVDAYDMDVASVTGTTQQTIPAPATTATVTLAACPYPNGNCASPKKVRFRVRAHTSAGYGPYSDYTQWVRPLISYSNDNINSIWAAKQCTSCHTQGSKLNLSGSSQDSYTSIVNANVATTAGAQSNLLTCPTGMGVCSNGSSASHPGGQNIAIYSKEYSLILQWIEDGRRP